MSCCRTTPARKTEEGACSGQHKGVISFNTSRFGQLTTSEDRVISFVKCIPGFERLRRFILIDHDGDGCLKWLQSVEDPMVAFLLINPNLYKPDYEVVLKVSDIDVLGANNSNDIVTLVMVSASLDNRQVSLNLRSPFIFNSGNMKAIQCIIDRDEFQPNFQIKF